MTESIFKKTIDAAKSHIGQGREQALGSKGPAWCSEFLGDMFKKGGLKDILAGCENVAAVKSVLSFGEKEQLNSKISKDHPPAIGSLVTIKNQGHIMMVTEVLPDNKVKIIEGNWSKKVGERVVSLSQLDQTYMDGDKMQQKLVKKGVVLPSSDPAVVNSKTAEVASAMTTNDPATGQPASLTSIYDQQQKTAGQGTQAMQMMQLVVALLMMLSGKSEKIPTQEAYSANSNAGRDALQQADKERASGQATSASQVTTGTTVAPSSTPKVANAPSKVPQQIH